MPTHTTLPHIAATHSLRGANLHDVPQLVRLINLAYEAEAFCLRGPRTDPADLMRMMQSGTFLLLFEKANPDTIMGTVFCRIEAGRGYLGMLAVDTRYRGQNLARYLIATVEQRCLAAGCDYLDLTVVSQRKTLIEYYARLGFVVEGELPFPVPEKILIPLHLVKMHKAL